MFDFIDLTDTEMMIGAGGLLMAWMLLGKGGMQTYKLVAFAGMTFLAIAMGLKGLPSLS